MKATETPATATPTDADKRYAGWHMRTIFWTPEVKAKADAFLQMHPRIPRYAARLAKRRFPDADYDDLLSEAMYATARCAASYDPAGGRSFGSYAIRFTCRTARDYAAKQTNARRSRGVRTVAMQPHNGARGRGGILRDLIAKEDVVWVRAWVRDLPARDRAVVEMRLAGMGYAEIAAHPDVGPTTPAIVRVVYSKNVRWLREVWAERNAAKL